jgi:hypothetical protein
MRIEDIRRSKRGRPHCCVLALWGFLALTTSRSALADEPLKAGEPHVLSEPTELTQVVDAFDDDDPFDLHFTIGFQNTWKSANIRRETYIGGLANPMLTTGGYTSSNMNVASYSESTALLNTRVDVGVYKDIGVYFRMPIVLSNTRSLDDLNGSAGQQGLVLMGAPGEQLFSLPFKSPKRSGIDYLAVGADFGITNQWRDPSKPTWVFGLEGRFSVGEPMHACNANPAPGQVDCAQPSDYNRNGQAEGGTQEGTVGGQRSAGVSRGTDALEIHTYVSKRIKYIEPYLGFRALFEFQQDRSDFGQTDLQGSLVNHPPFEGWMIMGLSVIPWENREQFQRITFDLRGSGAYRSEGRDYSELFDALGSSSAASLRQPNYAGYMLNTDPATAMANPSVVNPNSERVYFNGITDVSAHGVYQASASATWQVGEYIKFQVGAAYSWEQSHTITADQPCNPNFTSDLGASGPCHESRPAGTTATTASVTGIPNPNYRPTIDLPGRRFRADDVRLWDAWVNGVVMF